MAHSEYELRLLAKQRASELIAQAEHLNESHAVRRCRRTRHFWSVLIPFRRPAPDRTVIDLRELPPPEPSPIPPMATDAAERPPGAGRTDLRFQR